jgi:hypothetical protein
VAFPCLRLKRTCSALLAPQPKTRACSRTRPRQLHQSAVRHCAAARISSTAGWRLDGSDRASRRVRSTRAPRAGPDSKGFDARPGSRRLTGCLTVRAPSRHRHREVSPIRWMDGSISAVASFEPFDCPVGCEPDGFFPNMEASKISTHENILLTFAVATATDSLRAPYIHHPSGAASRRSARSRN